MSNGGMIYFIIEHPTRGTLQNTSEVGAPRWSWSRARSDDNVMRSYSEAEARETLETYVNPEAAEQCKVLRSPGPRELEWEVTPV